MGEIKTLNGSDGVYYPIRIFQKSMFYQTLSTIKEHTIKIYEMPMTISALEINDSPLRLDRFTRTKQFVEWGTPRFIDEMR